ncbi:hypothetical protein HYALB_00012236 [Hymenoscyphus albidus]|uniref:Uncharacterized protein n=1 Tax=Hymenoscyphus albidus TaxID=595503 RepID=A0A9N9LMZ6_9HELO|nr:hypothetical protein HYALB_00012236 [Hymenoscyphus albidus]
MNVTSEVKGMLGLDCIPHLATERIDVNMRKRTSIPCQSLRTFGKQHSRTTKLTSTSDLIDAGSKSGLSILIDSRVNKEAKQKVIMYTKAQSRFRASTSNDT